MHKKIIPVLIIASVIIACSSAKVYVDYDREVDLHSYQTFAWAGSSDTSMEDTSPLIHGRTVSYITGKMVAGGLQETEENPDLFVTYHTDEQQEMQLQTDHFGYGYGGGYYRSPYWGGGMGRGMGRGMGMGMGMGSTTTRVYTYTRGTLIIDLWDAETKKVVWRGVVENVVSENPQNAEAQIYAAIDKMTKKWQKMK